MSKWQQKQAKKAEFSAMKDEEAARDSINPELNLKLDTRAAAMGQGEQELFEKKLSKDEKKALAKAKRDAKKKEKGSNGGGDNNSDDGDETASTMRTNLSQLSLNNNNNNNNGNSQHGTAADANGGTASSTENVKEMKREAALENLSHQNIAVTYESKKGMLHANTRDINVSGVTVTFHGKPLIEDTEIVINYGNRYGFIGPNGSGKSTIMKMIAARAIPIPDAIDIYFLDAEYEASDTVTALEAVLDVQDEVHALEARAEALNHQMADTGDNDDLQNAIQIELEGIYSKLDQLDVNTAEARAAAILFGLGFTKKMQTMKTREFSGGWRMRIALARALFLKPEFLLLDEPTNHLDMDAVIWLEEYLSDWDRILFFVCHSQDFLNNVATHIVRLDATYKKLRYYSGNYDMYMQLRRNQDMVQTRQYEAEQRDIAEIKDFIARFGHGTAKLVRQAQSREKLLQKKLEAGLTDKPEEEKIWDWNFPDAGQLPVPVLAIEKVTFAYPGCNDLYTNVDFGVDLQTRVALVGPNGAGKTTLFKLICGELLPTKGQIKMNQKLKISRFTQHFEDKLDLSMTPIDFFKHKVMPEEPLDRIRPWLGRYGCGGEMQVQVMDQLSAGQKARIVFAIIAWEKPHLLLLDEPTNPLDMESIDALARCLQNFKGGVIMISHDMRLVLQCAEQIYICDHKKIARYDGDIMGFKMHTRKENNKRLAQHVNG